MTKQTITTEIDIPDGYEFVRIGKVQKGESYLFGGNVHMETATPCEHSGWLHVIVSPIWQPPSWMRPGWIFADSPNEWFWTEAEPKETPCGYVRQSVMVCIYTCGKPTVGDFTPPPGDDWRQSKRRIGGAE